MRSSGAPRIHNGSEIVLCQIHLADMQPFERIEAWKLCHELAVTLRKTTRGFPRDVRYELTSQIRRAAYSAAANIVEGAAKRGCREFRRYLDISLGSLAELAYALICARDVEILDHGSWKELEKLRARAGYLTWRLYESISSGEN